MDYDASQNTILNEWFTANHTIPTAKHYSYLNFPITLFGRKSSENGSHAVEPMSLGECTLFTHLQENVFISGCC